LIFLMVKMLTDEKFSAFGRLLFFNGELRSLKPRHRSRSGNPERLLRG
jgi:hypothetical protein